jgi:hypothetical protein
MPRTIKKPPFSGAVDPDFQREPDSVVEDNFGEEKEDGEGGG